MMVQGKGITAKWGAGFCFRAVHQRGMAATGRDVRCGSRTDIDARKPPLIPAHKIGRKKARLLGQALIHWVERGE
jgi:hypothetical protein